MMTQEIPTEATSLTAALDSLPTLPVVALQIGDIVHSKNASVPQVAELLRADPATSAKLLRLVNSPYFGIPGGVSDVAKAIPFVGFNTLYQLVLSITVLDTLGTSGAKDAKGLWVHSLTVATAARELANDARFSDAGACFTAGLLHDMGTIALAKVDAQKTSAVLEAVRAEGIPLDEAERRFGLASHDKIGSRLARQWRFPALLSTPIEQHHSVHRAERSKRLAPNLRTITEIVAVADHLSRVCAQSFTAGRVEDGEEDISELFDRNGLSQQQRDALCDRTRRALERSKIFLSILDQ